MNGCNQESISDETFKYFKNLKVLEMEGCNQRTITSKAFYYLKNVLELSICNCDQETINESFLDYICHHVQKLKMINCKQLKFNTKQHYFNLRKIKELYISKSCIENLNEKYVNEFIYNTSSSHVIFL
jgi:hypothetical protein